MKKRAKSVVKEYIGELKDSIARDTALTVLESFSIEMNSDGVLHVKGISEVLEFEEEKIVLLCDKFMISISGKNMLLKSYSTSETAVAGDIRQIEFTR